MTFLRSWTLTGLLGATAFVLYFAHRPGWTGAVALGIVVALSVAGLRQLLVGEPDPDQASVAEFEARRRALR